MGTNAGARSSQLQEFRDFTDKARANAAKSGAALPDGSFPILNRGDLKNAIQAIGRAKDPEAARAHIIKRAKALGLTSLLPTDWKKDLARETPYQMTFGLSEVELAAIRANAGKGEAVLPFFHRNAYQPMSSEQDKRRVYVGADEEADLRLSVERQKTPPPVLYRHGKDPVKGGQAAGKVKGLAIVQENEDQAVPERLGAACSLNAEAAAEVKAGKWYGVSAGVLCYEHEDGSLRPFELVEVSLVNTPAVDGLGEILVFSRETQEFMPWDGPTASGGDMDMDEMDPLCAIRKILNLPVAATLDEIVEQLKRLDATSASMEGEDPDEFATLAQSQPGTNAVAMTPRRKRNAKSGQYAGGMSAHEPMHQISAEREGDVMDIKVTPELLKKLKLESNATADQVTAALLGLSTEAGAGSAATPPPTAPASIDDIVNAVFAKVEDKATKLFESKAKSQRVTALFEQAKEAGKLAESDREDWLPTIEADPDRFEKKMLPKMPVKAPVRSSRFHEPASEGAPGRAAAAPRSGTASVLSRDEYLERLSPSARRAAEKADPELLEQAVEATAMHQFARKNRVSFEAAKKKVELERAS